MKKAMTITYEVDGELYVNVTNRCSNRCSFCIRNNDDGAYGSDSLWLEREPSCEEILESIFSRDLSKYKEMVFCGYGEPSYRLDVVRSVAMETKRRVPHLKIRINTNGQSDLILGRNTAPDYKDAFDSVSISLNASNSERYAEICHPVFNCDVLSAIIEFAKNVNKYVQTVQFSIVRQFLSEEEIKECEEISKTSSIPLRIREYISN